MDNFNYNQFTPLEWRVLQALDMCFSDTCPNYGGIMFDLELIQNNENLSELKKSVQHLKKLGYVITERGLMDDDGMVAGSGFSLAYEKRREVRDLLLDYEGSVEVDVARNMKQYGGSFVKSLGELILHADPSNLAKLKATFSEYFDEYHPTKWGAKNG